MKQPTTLELFGALIRWPLVIVAAVILLPLTAAIEDLGFLWMFWLAFVVDTIRGQE